MAELKTITEDKLRHLAGEKGFNLIYLEKDYFLTLLLYLMKDEKEIYFKGGTALNKIYLDHTRLSEDLDFTYKGNMTDLKDTLKSIQKENKIIFPKQEPEKTTPDFFRMKVYYKSHFQTIDHLIIDVNKKASLLLKPQLKKLPHFYENIPKFNVSTLHVEELLAEKARSLITRNQPRDYFDIYMALLHGYKLNQDLIKKKMRDIDQEFDAARIFKNAHKIYTRWDQEIAELTNKPVDFMKVIKKLQREFKYKTH